VALKLNAIVLQVRPACDALYDSRIEPWSPYLTGTMGKAPEPRYDPLEFACTEAHARGLELHAWFNPFRALTTLNASTSSGHVTRTHPEWVRTFGKQLWLDPGEPAARQYSLDVIIDVVRRYDVDGVHIDDYFYPYPLPSKQSFPDDASYGRYREKGGRLERDDWRRDNINQLVQQIYERVKATKRWVKFGISPFGVWRPRVPESIGPGLDSYGEIYADSRKWLQEGWCDYFTPQLYWSIQPAKQSFPVLLKWWSAQNVKSRHVWAGIATERIGPARPPQEIVNQIALTRGLASSRGHVHWNMKALMRNKAGIGDLLIQNSNREFALVPPSSWLGGATPGKPIIVRDGTRLSWSVSGNAQPAWWLAQARVGDTWTARLVPGTQLSGQLPAADAVAMRAIDRTGMISEATVFSLR
jgi:uncharacterized lipoprotein YddW (UPF0748 family)